MRVSTRTQIARAAGLDNDAERASLEALALLEDLDELAAMLSSLYNDADRCTCTILRTSVTRAAMQAESELKTAASLARRVVQTASNLREQG